MGYKTESKHKLSSDFLSECLQKLHEDRATAVATAIEGVDDPNTQEVKLFLIQNKKITSKNMKRVFASFIYCEINKNIEYYPNHFLNKKEKTVKKIYMSEK